MHNSQCVHNSKNSQVLLIKLLDVTLYVIECYICENLECSFSAFQLSIETCQAFLASLFFYMYTCTR